MEKTWGGKRPGAGRKKGGKNEKPSFKTTVIEEAAAGNLSPLAYMLKVMNDPSMPPERRDKMAVSAAPYCHARKGEGTGKKEEQKEKAKAAGKGKFAPSRPPGLALVEK